MREAQFCPECAEEVGGDQPKCRHCGAVLFAREDLPSGDSSAARSVMRVACLLLVIATIVAAITIPSLIEARGGGGRGNETGAIGCLKTIGTAQSLFREADKEADGNLDYGTLEELATSGTTGLIDGVLGSGTKVGYLFEATYGATTSELMWFATARPALPHVTGTRYFCTNHEGVTFYTSSAPFALNSVNCTIPAGALPIGQ